MWLIILLCVVIWDVRLEAAWIIQKTTEARDCTVLKIDYKVRDGC